MFDLGGQYTGQFRDGNMEGNGVRTHPDGMTYRGKFERNFPKYGGLGCHYVCSPSEVLQNT